MTWQQLDDYDTPEAKAALSAATCDSQRIKCKQQLARDTLGPWGHYLGTVALSRTGPSAERLSVSDAHLAA